MPHTNRRFRSMGEQKSRKAILRMRRIGDVAKVDGVRLISELTTFVLFAFLLPAAAQGPSVATLTLSLCTMKKGFSVCREVLSSTQEAFQRAQLRQRRA